MQTTLAEWLFLRTIQLTRMHLSSFCLLHSSIKTVRGVLGYFNMILRLENLAFYYSKISHQFKVSRKNLTFIFLMNVPST